MKRALFTLVILVAILFAGGAISSQLLNVDLALIQTSDPNASVFEATPEQATLFFGWALFVVINLVVFGGILAVFFWLSNREVERARKTPNRSETTELSEAASEGS